VDCKSLYPPQGNYENRRKKFKSLKTACSFAKQDETFTYKVINSRILMKKETSDIAPPRPRGTFSLFFMYFRECFNPERRGIPLYLNPLDIPRYFEENRFWGRVPESMLPSRPWLNYDLVRWVERRKPATVLEWGAGASTLWLAKISRRVVSIEHSPEWYSAVEKRLSTEKANRVELNLVEEKSNYVAMISCFKPPEPELILIDGLWRSDCFLAALPALLRGTQIIIHDSNNPEVIEALRKIPQGLICLKRFGPCHGIKNFRAWSLLKKA
jgi:hypothetical protein